MNIKSYILLFLFGLAQLKTTGQTSEIKDFQYFLDLLHTSSTGVKQNSLDHIDSHWQESYEIYAVETLYFIKDPNVYSKLFLVLQKHSKKDFGFDFNAWYDFIWDKEPTYDANYYSFKAALHSIIDQRFISYFLGRSDQSEIRLDEVRWGGVVQDGIPPLRNPAMIPAHQADYLEDDHIVFGISINGDARAYPRRILAWHELFTDEVGGTPVAGVYCTLCGTVILYQTEHNGIAYELGTSGFLYRSNKLMYDKKTQSLWNTLWGKPVIGPLVGKGIELEYLSVVTTNWGSWKKLHPNTTVLSLQTGYDRNYEEGVAYQDYFATHELMFNVPDTDKRLKNKDEILAIRLPGETDENIAISSKYLKRNPIFKHAINNRPFTVFTDKSGAHRVYFTENVRFVKYDGEINALDETGKAWILGENSLKPASGKKKLERLASHNAFWFGYRAAFPNTRLIK